MPVHISNHRADKYRQLFITKSALNYCINLQTDISRDPRRIQPCYICPGGG